MSKKQWKADLSAGIQVFLIALPLSLGIAIASGFPPLAGIVAAVVGGVIVSRINGSHVTINGPAAGLIVVILAGVEKLGHGDMLTGYKLTLAAIVCAGVLQIVLGLLRAGRLSTVFPGAVVHGMLAAIGLTIMVKQFPVMLGVKPAASSVLGVIFEFPQIVMRANPLVAVIGLCSLVLLILLKVNQWKPLRAIPAPILVIAVGTAVAAFIGMGQAHSYDFAGNHFNLGPNFLVSLPERLFSSLGAPDFSRVATFDFFTVMLSIGLVASLETLLSAAAVDKLDPEHRKSNLNKDLVAMGVGTVISGCLGGLPMIAEIVRSSANVSAGGRTGWSNFFHGVLLLLAVLIFPNLLRLIPLSALAALLVFTGYRLASPAEFLKMKRVGQDQLIIFVSTLVGVIATDLLIGVAIGIVVKLVMHILRKVPLPHLVRCRYHLATVGEREYVMRVQSSLVFCNLMSILGSLEAVPRTAALRLDLSEAQFIDHTAMERLTEIGHEFTLAGGKFELIESERHYRLSSHNLAARKIKV